MCVFLFLQKKKAILRIYEQICNFVSYFILIVIKLILHIVVNVKKYIKVTKVPVFIQYANKIIRFLYIDCCIKNIIHSQISVTSRFLFFTQFCIQVLLYHFTNLIDCARF